MADTDKEVAEMKDLFRLARSRMLEQRTSPKRHECVRETC